MFTCLFFQKASVTASEQKKNVWDVAISKPIEHKENNKDTNETEVSISSVSWSGMNLLIICCTYLFSVIILLIFSYLLIICSISLSNVTYIILLTNISSPAYLLFVEFPCQSHIYIQSIPKSSFHELFTSVSDLLGMEFLASDFWLNISASNSLTIVFQLHDITLYMQSYSCFFILFQIFYI